MKRRFLFAGRMLALGFFSTVVLPACGGDATPGSSPGIIWNSTSGSGASTGGPQPGMLLWNDPNSVAGGGFSVFIPSSDPITYGEPTVYIADNYHPLSTVTGAPQVTTPESGLLSSLNTFRSQQVSGGGNGGGFGGGLNGGVVQPVPNATLARHEGLTRNARANCKHFALFHPGPFAEANPEGDRLTGGGVAPQGRLAKTGIATGGAVEFRLAGPQYPDFTSAASTVTGAFGNELVDLDYTHIGVGYWTGGSQQHYWCIILARNPTP